MTSRTRQTVREALDRIAVNPNQDDKTNIDEVASNDLFILHYDLGKFIRQEGGLWRDNVPLLIDCQRIKEGSAPDQPTINPDDASMVIIEALWRRLRDQ